ncbi:MAG: N-acetyl sugar amidotransferase, partial [Desulfamplus sp.]|nr:N-acetyl sugar amidotransferase [Desulfamplus sp.]
RQLLDKHRREDGHFVCLVPVSGGKDGSYVAYNLKHKYGMNPLALTVTPALALEIGEQNLKSFVAAGYNHISINPAYEAMRVLNRVGLLEMGFPYYGWLIAIQAGVVRMASKMGIGLIFYGEDGEVEYGGSTETDRNPIYDVAYMKKIYLEGGYEKVIKKSRIPQNDLYFFSFPSDEELMSTPIDITHWSYFENWDPYRNYLVAKEQCGLKEAEANNSGTFTNFSQNDQALYALHTYLMYLKFGFGRANQDASIEVRRGAMDRAQAVNLVRLYDGLYPEEFLQTYLDYYQISREQFDSALDRWANRDLFEKVDGYWQPRFIVS